MSNLSNVGTDLLQLVADSERAMLNRQRASQRAAQRPPPTPLPPLQGSPVRFLVLVIQHWSCKNCGKEGHAPQSNFMYEYSSGNTVHLLSQNAPSPTALSIPRKIKTVSSTLQFCDHCFIPERDLLNELT